MKLGKISFVKSSPSIKECPRADQPEFAFIGRSNVGKSSLINMLCGRKNLAKTSSRPGKTQLINHFHVDGSWYLVDLPGYGYAGVSRDERKAWARMIQDYARHRESLACLFVLIDVRHEPQKNDLEFINGLGRDQVPFALIFTKADKIGKKLAEHRVAAFHETLLAHWEALPESFVTSAVTGRGRDRVMAFIEKVLSTISAG